MTEPITPEQERLLARYIIFTKLSTYAGVETMLVALNSENEEVEIWALNSLREFGKILQGQMGEPDYIPTYKIVIDWMSKL